MESLVAKLAKTKGTTTKILGLLRYEFKVQVEEQNMKWNSNDLCYGVFVYPDSHSAFSSTVNLGEVQTSADMSKMMVVSSVRKDQQGWNDPPSSFTTPTRTSQVSTSQCKCLVCPTRCVHRFPI